MKLYHVSDTKYEDDYEVILNSNVESTYYVNASPEQKAVIDVLEKVRTEKYPELLSRRNALFAFDCIRYAYWYKVGEHPNGFIYEIEMEPDYKGPFVLINTIMQNMNNAEKATKIAEEYYNPDCSRNSGEPWYVYEYLGKSFKVLCTIDHSDSYDNFTVDRIKSERLFGKRYSW